MAKKITQYPASGGNPDVGSLIDISELSGGVYTTKKLTIQQLLDYLTANLNINQEQAFKNNTGATITAGTPCELVSSSSNVPTIQKIKPSFQTGLSKIFIATQNVLNGATGTFIETGIIDYNTSMYPVGTKLYYDTTNFNFTDNDLLEDQVFIGVVLTQNVNGKIFVAPTRSPQLIKGLYGQVPLFNGVRKINGSAHFTYVDNNGTEVGFRFSDDANNLTQVGVTYLNVESEGIASNSVLRLANWANNTNKGIVSFRKSRGTKTTPTKVLAQDVLGSLIFAGSSDKFIDGVTAPISGMTTGEIIVRALNNFIKNYDTGADETYSQGLTQFEIWLQKSNGMAFGDFTPLNIKVFSVDGDGKVYFKNYNFPINAGTNGQILITDGSGNLTWQNIPSSGLSGSGSLDKVAFWSSSTGLTYSDRFFKTSGSGSEALIIDNTSNPTSVFKSYTSIGEPIGMVQKVNGFSQFTLQSFSNSGAYPQILLERYRGAMGSSLPTQSGDILGMILIQGVEVIKSFATESSTTGKGSYIIFSSGVAGTTNSQEVIRLKEDGKLRIANVYDLPKVDGTANQVIKTDGSGTLSWANVLTNLPSGLIPYGDGQTNIITGGMSYSNVNNTLVVYQPTSGVGQVLIKCSLVSDSASIYPKFVNSRFKVSGGYVITGDITGAFATNTNQVHNIDIITTISTENHGPSTAGTDVLLNSIPNGGVVSLEVARLKQDGKLRIGNAYDLPKVDGTTGQVLVTDGAGNVSWGAGGSATDFIPRLQGHEVFKGVTHRYNSVTYDTYSGYTMTITGAQFAKGVGTGSYYARQILSTYTPTATGTGSYGCLRGATQLWSILGGFYFVCEYAIADTGYAVGTHNFIGLTIDNTALAIGSSLNNQPSALTNIIAVANDSGDANLQIMHNDASGVATKIDLGANFPSNRTAGTALTTMYLVEFYNAPNNTSVKYRVTNKETGAVATGIITTNLPASSNLLTYQVGRSMGTSAGGVNNSAIYGVGRLGFYNI